MSIPTRGLVTRRDSGPGEVTAILFSLQSARRLRIAK